MSSIETCAGELSRDEIGYCDECGRNYVREVENHDHPVIRVNDALMMARLRCERRLRAFMVLRDTAFPYRVWPALDLVHEANRLVDRLERRAAVSSRVTRSTHEHR